MPPSPKRVYVPTVWRFDLGGICNLCNALASSSIKFTNANFCTLHTSFICITIKKRSREQKITNSQSQTLILILNLILNSINLTLNRGRFPHLQNPDLRPSATVFNKMWTVITTFNYWFIGVILELAQKEVCMTGHNSPSIEHYFPSIKLTWRHFILHSSSF